MTSSRRLPLSGSDGSGELDESPGARDHDAGILQRAKTGVLELLKEPAHRFTSNPDKRCNVAHAYRQLVGRPAFIDAARVLAMENEQEMGQP